MYSKEPFKRIHTYFMLNQNFNVQFTPFNLADRRSLQNTQGMFFSRVLRDSTPRYVGRSVGRLLPFWAAAPKGSMTYAFTHKENFLLLLLLLLLLRPLPPSNPSLEAQIPVSRSKSQSQGPNPSLKAQILASRPKS